MITESALLKNRYFDSVFLMRVAKRLTEQPGINQAALVMGTPKNIQVLAEAGYHRIDGLNASSNDLVISLRADSAETARLLIENLDEYLARDTGRPAPRTVRSTEQALTQQPTSNIALVSVPGEFAAREARQALQSGLNVFLFSDHVSVADELSLKRLALEKGLLLMGPDCGTSIIGGVGLGFANAVRRGGIGVIGASGTGTQEVTSLVHRWGSGISHAIGVGGRDLSDDIGAISTLQALDALEKDPGTDVILLVSKPPGTATIARVNERVAACSKPVVTCYLGGQQALSLPAGNVTTTHNLDDAATAAIRLGGGIRVDEAHSVTPETLERESGRLRASQRYVRGVFSGGTLCYQAQQALRDAGLMVHSNEPLEKSLALADSALSVEHTLVDMGADEFTEAKPHPMVDSTQRIQRILSEAGDPQVAVLLLDCVLGYVAAEDPGGDIAPAISEARRIANLRSDHLCVVASVCGTELDHQGLAAQVRSLEEAGAIVFTSAFQAARFAARLVTERG
ncbi:MAG: acyl-CoA synthetase FdrA [Chloroflexi bacterium]|nr:acyl-CoA synthetase FdrA [Chloroflexota bacterium]MDA1271941.1 acyl-CoA synthetase FdrA [Chloroflexota bacterium]